MERKHVTMDGNTAASHVSYAFTEVAAIYPISPSSTMAENADRWSVEGRKNIFDQPVSVVQMQSEAGAAGAVHGSLVAGALTTTFTCSQGLLLMIPNMYKIAGELLPAVINVSARAIATHALSIFGDHSDIYACRQTGFAMIASTNPQEVMDLSAVVHLSAIEGSLPFIHFFDGYRTSDEIQKIKAWSTDQLKSMTDFKAIEKFRLRSANPETPNQRGTAQNPDIFFQAREAINIYYDKLPKIVEKNMEKINSEISTNYKLFNYYGHEQAEHIIVAMGSVCDTIEETIDYLIAQGEKVGLIKVRLFRPFSVSHFKSSIPKTTKIITVLDRGKESGAVAEPLYLDVVAALKDTEYKIILNGRYGLASKNTAPNHIAGVYKNKNKSPFTVGIVDDVTNLSIEPYEIPDTSPKNNMACKFWGLGSDGTVGANKNSVKIIGQNTELYAQAYFAYDSKKSGGLTISHLRFGKDKIKSTYFIENADFVACHNPSYVNKYDMISDLKPNGTFLLNCPWNEEELESRLSDYTKRYIAENNIQFYTIDGVEIARELGLGGRINTILQSAFFKLSDIIPIEKAVELMKKAATDTYIKKGDNIVEMNHKAIENGIKKIKKVTIPDCWKELQVTAINNKIVPGNESINDFVNDIVIPVNSEKGNELPVSVFTKYPGGVYPSGSGAFEKRGIATHIPCWKSENCIQCNFCSYVCPHAVIRPTIMSDEEAENAPENMNLVPMNGMPGYKFGITVSALDCTGCGSCINVCPGKKGEKALGYQPIDSQLPHKQDQFYYGQSVMPKPEVFEKFKETTVKGSQFKKPLFEFSGACAGCGETPYAKLATQLFGERMLIANATGCSSIWGGSIPTTPYTKNKEGFGPAWSNSLFEDNAEFGYGMLLAEKALRNRLHEKVKELKNKFPNLSEVCDEYLNTFSKSNENAKATKKLVDEIKNNNDEISKEIINNKKFLSKKSIWIFGGDGWAYDIGFGGLDHVIASEQNVNILVFDTEIYSNTGGQSSKSTPYAAIAKFATGGKKTKKKSLSQIAMTYENVYVAQISQGADYNQCIKAFIEAESYDGPSIIIAYSPCISHGIKTGMGSAQTEEKKAVESGYWNLFRYDPRLIQENKNPFQLDSKDIKFEIKDFMNNEVRYNELNRKFPETADNILNYAKELSDKRHENYKNKANN